jgi:hypothetical protein
MDLNQIEQEVLKIKERNQRVEIDKKWEISWFRRLLIMIFTYLAMGFYLSVVSVDRPWFNAIVPAVAFMLSTLTLPFLKRVWIKINKL